MPFDVVASGADAVAAAFARLRDAGTRHAIVDALSDADLMAIGGACADLPLVTGGSGVALGLPENFRRAGRLPAAQSADVLPAVGGTSAVLSGSCSTATLAQVAHMRERRPALQLDPHRLANEAGLVAEAIDWACGHLADGPPLIYASAPPDEVQQAQAELGRAEAGDLVEQAMGEIARALVAAGVRRLVVAGGETSGAVVQALGVDAVRIGPQIDPGVPWTLSLGEPPIALALKSGNFGSEDFFLKALEQQA